MSIIRNIHSDMEKCNKSKLNFNNVSEVDVSIIDCNVDYAAIHIFNCKYDKYGNKIDFISSSKLFTPSRVSNNHDKNKVTYNKCSIYFNEIKDNTKIFFDNHDDYNDCLIDYVISEYYDNDICHEIMNMFDSDVMNALYIHLDELVLEFKNCNFKRLLIYYNCKYYCMLEDVSEGKMIISCKEYDLTKYESLIHCIYRNGNLRTLINLDNMVLSKFVLIKKSIIILPKSAYIDISNNSGYLLLFMKDKKYDNLIIKSYNVSTIDLSNISVKTIDINIYDSRILLFDLNFYDNSNIDKCNIKFHSGEINSLKYRDNSSESISNILIKAIEHKDRCIDVAKVYNEYVEGFSMIYTFTSEQICTWKNIINAHLDDKYSIAYLNLNNCNKAIIMIDKPFLEKIHLVKCKIDILIFRNDMNIDSLCINSCNIKHILIIDSKSNNMKEVFSKFAINKSISNSLFHKLLESYINNSNSNEYKCINVEKLELIRNKINNFNNFEISKSHTKHLTIYNNSTINGIKWTITKDNFFQLLKSCYLESIKLTNIVLDEFDTTIYSIVDERSIIIEKCYVKKIKSRGRIKITNCIIEEVEVIKNTNKN